MSRFTPEQRKEWNRKYYERTKHVHNPARLERKKAWVKEQQEFLDNIKRTQGCHDCGMNDPRAIEFDHLPGQEKLFCVPTGVSYSRKRLLQEIAKCETVCGSCHNIRTYERKHASLT